MARQYPRIPLLAYADRLAARPGQEVAFKVSSDGPAPFTAGLYRSISADPNPAGQGIVEQPVEAGLAPSFPSRRQAFNPGSYALIEGASAPERSLSLKVDIWPTRPDGGEQVIASLFGAELFVSDAGVPSARLGDSVVALDTPLAERRWHTLTLEVDAGAGALTLRRDGHAPWPDSDAAEVVADRIGFSTGPILFAAGLRDGAAALHFNGKIERPVVSGDGATLADWDFAKGTTTLSVRDDGPNGLRGVLVNHPARGMTGAAWDGSEMCWRHNPAHYGAIHFHDDDIYDFGWETDFVWTVPADLPSGVYVMRLRCGENEDAVPVFICPPKGRRTADLAVLVSTFTYVVYGNNARVDFDPAWMDRASEWGAWPWNPAEYPELGCSTYNFHSDGSGICHASHLRPLLSLRPGYLTFGNDRGSGLRHFQADSHLIAWLHDKNIAYDIVTDQELHDEGVEALRGYRAVTTGSHPEYHTPQTLDALTAYRDGGGKLSYLGGNGFYWRVALHGEAPGMIEIRRAEGGIRAWAAEPGEYYNAFDGGYGGLWRRNGRPPQMLAGVGFTAQGRFDASYYRRSAESRSPDLAWIFEGVEGDRLGDFGFSAGGAAGFELDRAEPRLGTPPGFRLLAQSEAHGDSFVLVFEEQLSHLTTLVGSAPQDLVRADMIYVEIPGGGAVFATGSITFCGSLPWNGFDNNISRLLENVLRRFLAGADGATSG